MTTKLISPSLSIYMMFVVLEIFFSFCISYIDLTYRRSLGHCIAVRYSLWLSKLDADNQRNTICFSTFVPQSQLSRCLQQSFLKKPVGIERNARTRGITRELHQDATIRALVIKVVPLQPPLVHVITDHILLPECTSRSEYLVRKNNQREKIFGDLRATFY